ncbi:MAG: Inositol monophosphatase family [Candidatus Parcubacteria bacterium]|jgi:fructose-1,6-bisphosphatase/inositol monophosphatase family enzyme
MTQQQTFGPLNGDAVGIIFKELVRRAIVVINAQRFAHEVTAKETEYKPGQDDYFTTADTAAQDEYVDGIRRAMPGVGIVAEEDRLVQPCTLPGGDTYVTIDSIDGTKAFIRRQSHGVGTMISLVSGHEIVSAYVGDVFTREIYGYRPGSNKVRRHNEFEHRHELGPRINRDLPLAKQYLLLRDDPYLQPFEARKLIPSKTSHRFKAIEITGGSIGISMARLWKGEVGGAVLLVGTQTPWDTFPVYGISRKLGFRFYFLDADGRPDGEWIPQIEPVLQPLTRTVLVAHESRLGEMQGWA